MTYATAQDLIDRFGETELIELTDLSGSGALDATAIARALADADAEINGYLAGKYSLPLSNTPPILIKFAGDIARYQLYDTRASEQVMQRYKDAIAFLKSVSNGTASLGIDEAGTAPVSEAGGVQFKPAARVFNADKLSDY